MGFEEAGQRGGQGHHPESRQLDENTLPSASDPLCHQRILLGTRRLPVVSACFLWQCHTARRALPAHSTAVSRFWLGRREPSLRPDPLRTALLPSPQSRKARSEERTRAGSPF